MTARRDALRIGKAGGKAFSLSVDVAGEAIRLWVWTFGGPHPPIRLEVAREEDTA